MRQHRARNTAYRSGGGIMAANYGPVEPVALDHYSEDCLYFGDTAFVRPLGSGFLVEAGEGEDVTFLVTDSLVAACRALKSVLADKS